MTTLRILNFLHIWFVLCSADQMTYNVTNLISYIHQLEQRISTLESHSKTTDQKYAAVLSSILSKLSSQTDKLLQFEAKQNSTSYQLEEIQTGLQEITFESNSSWKSVLKSVMTPKGNASEVGSIQSTPTAFLVQNVAFEARSSERDKIHHDLLKLTRVTYNAGDGYNPETGLFTAPVSGVYQVWFNIAFSQPSGKNTDATVEMVKGKDVVASSRSPSLHRDPNQALEFGIVSGIHLILLSNNDALAFKADLNGDLKSPSSYGAVLIH